VLFSTRASSSVSELFEEGAQLTDRRKRGFSEAFFEWIDGRSQSTIMGSATALLLGALFLRARALLPPRVAVAVDASPTEALLQHRHLLPLFSASSFMSLMSKRKLFAPVEVQVKQNKLLLGRLVELVTHDGKSACRGEHGSREISRRLLCYVFQHGGPIIQRS
jgi:hypothetical protein